MDSSSKSMLWRLESINKWFLMCFSSMGWSQIIFWMDIWGLTAKTCPKMTPKWSTNYKLASKTDFGKLRWLECCERSEKEGGFGRKRGPGPHGPEGVFATHGVKVAFVHVFPCLFFLWFFERFWCQLGSHQEGVAMGPWPPFGRPAWPIGARMLPKWCQNGVNNWIFF